MAPLRASTSCRRAEPPPPRAGELAVAPWTSLFRGASVDMLCAACMEWVGHAEKGCWRHARHGCSGPHHTVCAARRAVSLLCICLLEWVCRDAGGAHEVGASLPLAQVLSGYRRHRRQAPARERRGGCEVRGHVCFSPLCRQRKRNKGMQQQLLTKSTASLVNRRGLLQICLAVPSSDCPFDRPALPVSLQPAGAPPRRSRRSAPPPPRACSRAAG